MGFRLDKPLETLSDDALNQRAKQLWEEEKLGGLTEDNNRLPVPIVFLLILTIMTAFSITFPLWGQRPSAAIYAAYSQALDRPEVQAIADPEAQMAKIIELTKGSDGGKYDALRERHPLTVDDLKIIKPQIDALVARKVDLEEYNVVGSNVVMANFEGNFRPDGSRERKQPWWDKGYTIDIFFIIFFFTGVIIVVKRLPASSWQPRHDH